MLKNPALRHGCWFAVLTLNWVFEKLFAVSSLSIYSVRFTNIFSFRNNKFCHRSANSVLRTCNVSTCTWSNTATYNIYIYDMSTDRGIIISLVVYFVRKVFLPLKRTVVLLSCLEYYPTVYISRPPSLWRISVSLWLWKCLF